MTWMLPENDDFSLQLIEGNNSIGKRGFPPALTGSTSTKSFENFLKSKLTYFAVIGAFRQLVKREQIGKNVFWSNLDSFIWHPIPIPAARARDLQMVRRKNESCLICARAQKWFEFARARIGAARQQRCGWILFPFSLSEIMIVCFCSFFESKNVEPVKNLKQVLEAGKNGK